MTALLARIAAAFDIKGLRERPRHMVAIGEPGRAAWSGRDYATLVRQGYARNPTVFRAVRLVAEAVGSVPLYVIEGGKERDDHPLLTLLARPNPRQTSASLREAVASHLLLAGNAFLEAVTVDGKPVEIHALRPDRVAVIAGEDGWPVAYEHRVGQRALRLPAEGDPIAPVLHLAGFHPLNDHYGFAPLEAAQVPIDLVAAADQWNKSLLDNAARPSGALVHVSKTGAPLTRDQFQRLREELDESFVGGGNAGRPLLLEGGLDWKPLSLTPKDLDFAQARATAAREIALAFGVPPMLLGLPGDATYANYREANRALWRQTVLPLLARVLEGLEAWVAPVWPDAKLAYDADAVDALAEDREALWRRVTAADFLSEEEKRRAVGFGGG
jgi:HK97 family phage portal protein